MKLLTVAITLYDHSESVEETISQNFYVEDWLTGADDISLAKKLINDVRCQLATRQFPLRKIVSSSAEVMESLPSELRENEQEFSANDYYVKALGIKWLPTNNVVVFKVAHDLFKETFLRWRTKVHNVEKFDIARHVLEDSFELHLF